MSESLTGKLLVASPVLTDPNFDRAVVYLCAHSDDGAFGLVLNRPLPDEEVADHLPAWLDIVSSPSVFFRGGPVEPGSAFGLARIRAAEPAEGWMPVERGIGLVDLAEGPGELGPELRDLRLFTGYSGWSAGQLEGEIDAQAWFVVEADAADLFFAAPEDLWRTVVRRQTGKIAMFAHFPEDPSVN